MQTSRLAGVKCCVKNTGYIAADEIDVAGEDHPLVGDCINGLGVYPKRPDKKNGDGKKNAEKARHDTAPVWKYEAIVAREPDSGNGAQGVVFRTSEADQTVSDGPETLESGSMIHFGRHFQKDRRRWGGRIDIKGIAADAELR